MKLQKKDFSRLLCDAIASSVAVNPFGQTFYVQSTHTYAADTNVGQSPDYPLATLAQAIARCTTAKGDTIVIGHGHVENISTATQINVSKANVTIIGLGHGASRPTFTFTALTTSTFTVSGADVTLQNIAFVNGIDSLAVGLTVTGADFRMVNCRYADDGTHQSVLAVKITGLAPHIEGNVFRQETAGATACIQMPAAVNDAVIRGNDIAGDYSAACISNTTAAALNGLIVYNYLNNLNTEDVCIDLVGTATPCIHGNVCYIPTTDQITWIDTHDGYMGENWGVNADGERGILIGTESAAA